MIQLVLCSIIWDHNRKETAEQKSQKNHKSSCLSWSHLGISYPDPGLRFDFNSVIESQESGQIPPAAVFLRSVTLIQTVPMSLTCAVFNIIEDKDSAKQIVRVICFSLYHLLPD